MTNHYEKTESYQTSCWSFQILKTSLHFLGHLRKHYFIPICYSTIQQNAFHIIFSFYFGKTTEMFCFIWRKFKLVKETWWKFMNSWCFTYNYMELSQWSFHGILGLSYWAFTVYLLLRKWLTCSFLRSQSLLEKLHIWRNVDISNIFCVSHGFKPKNLPACNSQ